ncbi:MAG: hypothetical protein J0L72_10420 [Armatimonadetes bacterium]|nr:hypothetical protein [Armatimonadota bacterium]
MSEEPFVIVSDESGTEDLIRSLSFIAGPSRAIGRLNKNCKVALSESCRTEIKFKDIDDAGRCKAAKVALTAFLDCPDCRALCLTWSMQDSRRNGLHGRDDCADFHRMLFHGLRSVADWIGDKQWHWCHDQKSDLQQDELIEFLKNTRGNRSHKYQIEDLFGNSRHFIRIAKFEQRCSKQTPILGLADLLAGVCRHSLQDADGCVAHYRARCGQSQLELGSGDTTESPTTRATRAKREFVAYVKDECGKRRLGVSLESTRRLATRRKGTKFWIWHYEPQGQYDKAPLRSKNTGS